MSDKQGSKLILPLIFSMLFHLRGQLKRRISIYVVLRQAKLAPDG